MSILQEILRNKRAELKQTKGLVPLAELKARAKDIETATSFRAAVRREQHGPIKLIAELKKASPSEGIIRKDFILPEIISIYNKKDAHAVSVLTEKHYFHGSLEYLKETRERTKKPLLRKDFIFDDYQVYESKVNGADAILLIAASLDKSQLSDLQALSKELSLDCLVEVHSLKELDSALYSGAEIIGINNRNLNTLETNLNTTFDLIKDIPQTNIIVSESGIHTRADVERLESARVDAMLIGTAFMKADDIGAKIDELMGSKT